MSKNVVVRYEKAVVYKNGYFVPDCYTIYFTDGFTDTDSFSEFNGCLGIGNISEIIGTDYEDFGYVN
jgi:hypothetical protein